MSVVVVGLLLSGGLVFRGGRHDLGGCFRAGALLALFFFFFLLRESFRVLKGKWSLKIQRDTKGDRCGGMDDVGITGSGGEREKWLNVLWVPGDSVWLCRDCGGPLRWDWLGGALSF